MRAVGRRARYDVIIIGAGVAGAVVAALLSNAGLTVLILERNHALGGAFASTSRDGFKVDRYGHLLSRGERGPFGWVWRELGLVHPRFLTHRQPVRARGMLDVQAPESRLGLAGAGRQLMRRLGLGLADRRHFTRTLARIFTLREPELEELDATTLDTFLMNRIRHPGTHHFFEMLANVLFMLPTWRLSAGEAIRSLRWLLCDYSLSYVEGGLDRVPNTLLGIVDGCEGDVLIESRVRRVRRVDEEYSVATESGDEYRAPVVVANVPPKAAVSLLEDVYVPSVYRAQIAKLEPSGRSHTLQLALDRPLVEEGCMLGNLSSDGSLATQVTFDRMFESAEAAARGEVPDPIAMMAPVPTNFDPTLAPEGRQLVVANVYVPPGVESSEETVKERVLDALEDAVPGLKETILFEELHPLGAAIPNAQVPNQVGAARLPVTTPMPGFYITGWGAGGRGIGVELAASSALEVYFAITKDRA
jgi:prolycopene isomerase